MKFLITGHKGYIGQSLIRKLKILGHHTTGIDINYFNTYEKFNINLLKADNDINIDLRKINKLDLANIDVFVHLAALSNDPVGQLDPELTNEALSVKNVQLALVSICKATGDDGAMEMAQVLLPICHHPAVLASDPQIWRNICKRLKIEPSRRA